MSRPFRDQARTRPPATAMQARRPSHFTSATNSAASAGSPAAAVASIGAMKPGLFPAACPGIAFPRACRPRARPGSRLGGHRGTDLPVSTLVQAGSHKKEPTPPLREDAWGHMRRILALALAADILAGSITHDRKASQRRSPRRQRALRASGQAAGERRVPGVRRAAAAFLDPARDGVGVGPGQAAQPRRGPGQRLVRFALARALEDAGHLGQQVGPAPGQRSDFGQRGRLFVLGERAPPGAMPRLAGQLELPGSGRHQHWDDLGSPCQDRT